jgi:hypothetical protein
MSYGIRIVDDDAIERDALARNLALAGFTGTLRVVAGGKGT